MATKFKPWIDSPTPGTNIQANNIYATDGQRTNGFQPNTVASSIRVNTALRSATLVVAALMDAFLSNSTLDESSSMADVTSALSGVIAGLASPAFTGNPTAPTQTYTDNSTKLATTGFVHQLMSSFSFARSYTGAYNGTGTVGASNPTSITNIGNTGDTIKLVIIQGGVNTGIFRFGGGNGIVMMTGNAIGNHGVTTTYSGRTLSWYYSGTSAADQLNASGTTYYWVAFA